MEPVETEQETTTPPAPDEDPLALDPYSPVVPPSDDPAAPFLRL